MPRTQQGKWSQRLLGLSAFFFVVFVGLVASGQRGGETFFANGILAWTMIGAATAAMCAGCVGVSAFRRSDRSLLVIASIVIGAGVALWILAEIMFPH